MHFPPVPQCDVKVLLLIFSPKKRAFVGLIPIEQVTIDSNWIQGWQGRTDWGHQVLWQSIYHYIITQVILAFWLVLAYDLLGNRRTDDDSARFKFFWIFLILNLNQSQFFAKHSNQSVRFIFYRHKITSVLFSCLSVIDHRGRQNVVRTSVTHSAAPRVPLFCSYHILTSSVIYYWTDARQHGIYLLIWFSTKTNIINLSSMKIVIAPSV